MELKFIVPLIPKPSVDAAKGMLDRHPVDSDEYRLASMLIELAGALELLNGDLERSRAEWDRRNEPQ